MSIEHIQTREFLDEIFENGGAAVIDFWASWCAPCHALAPVYEALSEHFADEPVSFYKLSTEDHPELSKQFNVRSIPTVIFVLDGKVVDHAVGGGDPQRLRKKVNALLARQRGDGFFARLTGKNDR